ncbi:ATP-binding protein [archaeon]|jgi:SpoVK/Ycf46/Vps4 family AAA+-type ATPase|nr:ATP-binding protein [archaeon]
MFEVEVNKNLEKLYDSFIPKMNYIIGKIDIDEGGIDSIETTLAIFKEGYALDTIVAISENIYLPHKSMEFELNREIESEAHQDDLYGVFGGNKTQFTLRKNGLNHFIERYADVGMVVLTSDDDYTNKDVFEIMIKDHADLISNFINSHYLETQSESPELIYNIGKKSKEQAIGSELVKSIVDNVKKNNTKLSKELVSLEKKIEISNPQISFNRIGGCEYGKKEMDRIYEDIIHGDRAMFFGRNPEKKKGYLITGESGSGKTLLVKALASKLKNDLDNKIKFYAVNYENITSIYRGGEAQATGNIFKLVEKNEKNNLKTLLFLDEVHLIAQRKLSSSVNNEALDTLLSHLDGMNEHRGLTTIGATYMPVNSLDTAFVRRLNRTIEVGKPDVEGREEIFKIYFDRKSTIAGGVGNKCLFCDLDISKIAETSDGLNGSHIESIVERVVDAKEDEVMSKIKGKFSDLKLHRAFTAVTTEDVLNAIEEYPLKEKEKKRIGFGLK